MSYPCLSLSQQEAEISAFTLPEYRCNGYFKLLLSKAIQELNKFNIRDILFVCEKQSDVWQKGNFCP